MIHDKLDGLMTPVEKIARVANAGLLAATAPQTAPSGAISLDNADGTRTIIGEVVNGESNPSYTMATHVGDTTPPGIPTGITATSKSGVVVVEWDGTLSGGIPDDFFCVRIYLDNVELGALTEAGSVASAKLDGGTTVLVTATSEDDCCLPDGTPDHNVSQASQAISITVTSSAEEIIVDVEEEIEGIQQEITDFKGNTYTKAQTDKKVQDLDDEISTELTTNYYNKTQIDTNYATKTLVSQTKEEIKLSASQQYATKGESQPNLSPFFAHDLTDIYNATTNPDGYWVSEVAKSAQLGDVGTQLDDGWMHYELDNSDKSATAYVYFNIRPVASLKPSTAYTMLIELRNMVTDAPYTASFRITSQPDTSTAISQTVNPNGYDDIYLARGGTFCKALATKPDMSAANRLCSQYLSIVAGFKASFDIRLSLYETVSPELLLDTNAPTLTKVDGPFDRYITDAAQTQVTAAYVEIQDPPEELGSDARYGLSLDFDGNHTTWRTRSLGFYSGSTTGETRPTFMAAGKQYQASMWARKVSGTAYLRIGAISSDKSYAYQPTSASALALTDEWQLYSVSLRPVSPSYSRIAFGACFSASTAGAVELCGFSLQEMDATFKPYVTDQQALSKEYATQSQLTVGINGIRTEVSRDYQTKAAMGDYSTTAQMNTAIDQSAQSITSTVAATYETQSHAGTTYSTKSEVQQTVSGLDTRISANATAISGEVTARETLIRQYANGVLVCKVGESVGALVNASGSFDVVAVTWSGNNPTVTGTLSTFASNLVELGKNGLTSVIEMVSGLLSISHVVNQSYATGGYSRIESQRGLSLIGADYTDMRAIVPNGRSTIAEIGSYMQWSGTPPVPLPYEAESHVRCYANPLDANATRVDISARTANGSGTLHDASVIADALGGRVLVNGDSGALSVGPAGVSIGDGTAIAGVFFGSKVVNPAGAAYATLFTAAEAETEFGVRPNAARDVVLAMNGDARAYQGQLTAALTAGEVRVYTNPTKNGNIRVNYIVIIGA